VTRKQPELASIMDKALTLIKFDDVKYAGLQSVPALQNEQSKHLVMVVLGLVVLLLAILVGMYKIVRSLVYQKAQTRFLKEREHLLYTDPLTGFYNRNYFSHTREALQNAPCPQVALLADLNNLKRVNDSYGHGAGDALLVLFSQALRAQFPGAVCFRMGGDEFLLVLADTTEEGLGAEVEALAQRCLQRGHAVSESLQIYPSAAIGFAVRTQSAEPLDACIAKADAAMYTTKAAMKKRSTDA
jgi:diguanylate cyclase (GGDEF)-like protein